MIFATLANLRPDLLDIQLGLVRKFIAASVYVGVDTEDAEAHDAIIHACDCHGAVAIDLPPVRRTGYLDNLRRLLSLLPEGPVIYAEADLFPTARVYDVRPGFASRAYGEHTLMTWCASEPRSFDRAPRTAIQTIRCTSPDDLPKHLPAGVLASYAKSSRMEVVDGHWVHYDKASGVFRREYAVPKDEFIFSLAKAMTGTCPAKSWLRFPPELTAEHLERHERAVAEAQANPPKPMDRSCVHRGPVIEERQCPSCSGVVMVKVHECDMHKVCSLSNRLAGVRQCGPSCPDQLAPKSKG